MSELENKSAEEKRKGNPNWVEGGPSPNPGGRPKKLRALEAAVLDAETPERVKEVVDAMRVMALSGNPKCAPAAAKVYFAVIGLNGKVPEDFADVLKDAPPEVFQWLAAQINLTPAFALSASRRRGKRPSCRPLVAHC